MLAGGLQQQTQSTGHLNLQTLDVAKIDNEDWQALLKGERYNCQLIIGTGSAATDLRDVIVNINLSGIRLLDKKNEVRVLRVIRSSFSCALVCVRVRVAVDHQSV